MSRRAEERSIETPNIGILIVGDRRDIGGFMNKNFAAQAVGNGLNADDSEWIFVESNDGVFWSDIAGATFTALDNDIVMTEFTSNANKLGVKLTNKGTVNTGTIIIDVFAKPD